MNILILATFWVMCTGVCGRLDMNDNNDTTWAACVTGPGVVGLASCVATYDTDYDNDVDLRDFAYTSNLAVHLVCPGATKDDLLHTIVEIRRILLWPADHDTGCGRDYSCTSNQYVRLMQIHEAVVKQLLECERAAP